jgi:hypothetical protein
MSDCKNCGGGNAVYCQECADAGERDARSLAASSCSPLLSELKKGVSSVLQTVVRGHSEYRTEDGFLRWGRIESDIHGQIEAILEENTKDHLREASGGSDCS